MTDEIRFQTYPIADFKETGEYRPPKHGEFFISVSEKVVKQQGRSGWATSEPRVIVVAGKGRSGGATIPSDSAERKGLPVATGVIDYFPAALAEVARVSKYGNDKHNPGEPLHHARGKSTDHADALARHLIDRGHVDPDTGMRHTAELAWRALALLQQELEDAGEAPLPRGASEPDK